MAAALAGCGGGGGEESGSTVAGGEGAGATTTERSGTSAQGKSGKSGKSGGSSGKSGSDSGKSGKSATPSGGLSKAEFVNQANAICEKGKKQSLKEMAAYVKQHKGGSGQPGPALIVKAVKAVFIPGVETQIEEIRALGAPPGEEAKVDAFLAALEEGVEAAGEASGGSAGAAFGQGFKRSAKLAREYGLNGCAYG